MTARVPASKGYRHVREALHQGARALSRGDSVQALSALLRAAEECRRLATPEAAALRLMIGQVLWAVAPQVALR